MYEQTESVKEHNRLCRTKYIISKDKRFSPLIKTMFRMHMVLFVQSVVASVILCFITCDYIINNLKRFVDSSLLSVTNLKTSIYAYRNILTATKYPFYKEKA
jgi:hypothetical protein